LLTGYKFNIIPLICKQRVMYNLLLSCCFDVHYFVLLKISRVCFCLFVAFNFIFNLVVFICFVLFVVLIYWYFVIILHIHILSC
jgi:hypothetical protein